jgi:tetratricopeptide (TPR) repeat protein
MPKILADKVEDYLLRFLGDEPKTPGQVRTMMNRKIPSNPDIAELWNARAWANYELGEYDEAIHDASRAIELCPDAYLPWHIRGMSLWMKDEHEPAEADLTEAIRLSRSVRLWLEDAYRARGGIRCDANRLEAALDDLNRCLKLVPQDPWVRVYRGNAYAKQKKYRQALQDYEKAVSLDKDYAYAAATLAWFLATCPDGKFRDGRRAVKLAQFAVDSGEEDCLDHLAAAYAETGDFKAAVKTQKLAIKKCSNKELLERLKKRLALYEAEQPYRDQEDD